MILRLIEEMVAVPANARLASEVRRSVVKPALAIYAAAILSAASSCHAEAGTNVPQKPRQQAADRNEVIGVATQEVDGTLVLQLRTPSDSGGMGEAVIRYPKGDPNYASVARHIGPIPKDGYAVVKRFPE